MITSHLMFMAEMFGRNSGTLRSNESEDRPVSRLSRFLSIFGSRLRKHSPPMPLTNHMRRDIGLDPLPKHSEWQW